jgi:hypothetical protein
MIVTILSLAIVGVLGFAGPAAGRTAAACPGGRIVVAAGASLTLSNCTISGQTTTGDGGGVLNHGILTLTNVTVSGNHADGNGGGISNDGTLTLDHVVIDDNTSGGNGGGIWNAGTVDADTLTVGGAGVPNHAAGDGGGIWNRKQFRPIAGVLTVASNVADGSGGGIANDGGAFCCAAYPVETVFNVAVSDNTAGVNGGGVWNNTGGSFRVANIGIDGNTAAADGGGLYNESAKAPLEKGSITRNVAGEDGGGVYITGFGGFTGVNLTIAGNTAVRNGGGVSGVGGGLSSSTVDANGAAAGGNIWVVAGSGRLALANSIVAGPLSGGNCVGLIVSGGHNLDSDASCALGGTADLTGVSAGLAPPAYNGGPSFIVTQAPSPSSPVLGAGDLCPATDARGVARTACDIGAFAGSHASGTPLIVVTATRTSIGATGGQFDVTATITNYGDADATNGSATITLGQNLSLVSGLNTVGVATVSQSGGSQVATWHVDAAATGCDGYATAFDIRFDDAEAPGVPTLLHQDVVVAGCPTTVSGTVTSTTGSGTSPLGGAEIALCTVPESSCFTATTAGDGTYSIAGLVQGVYTTTVSPGASAPVNDLIGQVIPSVQVDGGANVHDFALLENRAVPGNVTLSGVTFDPFFALPIVDWAQSWTVDIDDCAGATATLVIDQSGTTLYSATMAEGPSGHYSAVIPPLLPNHGYFELTVTVGCSGSAGVTSFDGYIDPSGSVTNSLGAAILGAKVTLSRSDSPTGGFTAVPDGSLIMSLANRRNPDTTRAGGHFGWDVLSGSYRVHAEKRGCTSADSAVLAIPPAVTDLSLTLVCADELEQLVTGLSLGNAALAADLTTRARSAAAKLARQRPQFCHTLDGFVTKVVSEAGQNDPKLSTTDGRTLVAEAYLLETTFACLPATSTRPAAESAALDVVDSIAGATVQVGLAGDLRTALRRIGKEIADGHRPAACSKVASFARKVDGQRGKKLTDLQADALVAAVGAVGSRLDC